MTKEEELGRAIASHWDRSYDYDAEGQVAKDMAIWLLENYDIRKKLIFDW